MSKIDLSRFETDAPKRTVLVTLSMEDCMKVLDTAIVEGSFTGQRLDRYELTDETGALRCCVAVYEKYYYRVSNRMTLTATVDSLGGRTRVHWFSAGGGVSVLWRFDWGAADSFTGTVREALRPYILQE